MLLAAGLAALVTAWILRIRIIELLDARAEFDVRLDVWRELSRYLNQNPLQGWGWVGAFAFFLPLLIWLNFTFATYSAIPWPLTWGPTMLLAGYCALWPAAVNAAASWIAQRRGAAFGLRQTLDTVGAFAGPLLAIALMAATADDFRAVFWLATMRR